MTLLTRTLRRGSVGVDVFAIKRATHRLLHTGQLSKVEGQSLAEQQEFRKPFETLVKAAQRKHGLDGDGVVGPKFEALLVREKAIDARSTKMLADYAKAADARPALIQPTQGFSSLHRSLWPIYSIGRSMGLSDLGTYNPRSRLPSGAPSDHAVKPAFAFDLGIDPDTGWANPTGRAFFLRAMHDPAVEYVILGDRIGFRATQVIRAYTSGGHLNHLHVSGNR